MDDATTFSLVEIFDGFRELFVDRQAELETLHSELIGKDKRSAIVIGGPGTGKTSLALMFAHLERNRFPGGVFHIPLFRSQIPANALLHMIPETTTASLVILDELDYLLQEARTAFDQIMTRRLKAKMVLLTRTVPSLLSLETMPHLHLGNLTPYMLAPWEKMLLMGPPGHAHNLESIFERFEQKPELTRVVLQALRDRLFRPEELLAASGSFETPGIFGPDGRPLKPESDGYKLIVTEVNGVTDEVLVRLARDPKGLYEISPRMFEQVVAEIFRRMGYEVTLTPASKDGGKDICAAKRDDIGTFLYLVECKRYRPDTPIGVELIRQLYGVVEEQKATAGILATTSVFTKGARKFEEKVKFRISLQDYRGIHQWLAEVIGGIK